MSRGVGGMDIFESDDERVEFLAILADVSMKTGCRTLSYCLMNNHFHLLLQVAQVPLENIMRRLLSRYARRFNSRRGRKGHVFQARYLSKLCISDQYYRVLLAYINNNPVADGFVTNPADWKWSSHNQLLGPIRSTLLDVGGALGRLSDDRTAAAQQYLERLAIPIDEAEIVYDERPDQPEAPPKESLSLAELGRRVAKRLGVDVSRPTRSRNAALARARREFARMAVCDGFTVSEVARFMSVSHSTVSVAVTARL